MANQLDTDAYTYSNGALATVSSGKWTALSSFVSNTVSGNTIGTAQGADVIATFTGDTISQWSQNTVASITTGQGGPTLRSDAVGTFYVYMFANSAQADSKIFKSIAAVLTQLSTATTSFSATDVGLFEAKGGNFFAYKNGVVQSALTLSGENSIVSGKPGVYIDGTNITLDDWVAGDFAGEILFITSAGATIATAASTWSIANGGSSMVAGGAVVVGVGCASTSVTVSTITDGTTDVYLKAIAHGTPRSTNGAELWYCQGFSTTAGRIQLTLSGASSGGLGYAHFTGFSTGSALGPTGSSGITAVSSVHSVASVTPASSGVLVMFERFGASTYGTIKIGANYSQWLTTNAAGAARSFGQYWIQTAATADVGPSTTSSGVTHAGAIAVFYNTVVVGGGGAFGPVFSFCLLGIQ